MPTSSSRTSRKSTRRVTPERTASDAEAPRETGPAYLAWPPGRRPERLAERYDETSLWSAQFGALLFRHLEIRAGIRGLDVGCGTGFPLLEAAQRHGPSSRFTGIDVWPEALERARVKAALFETTVDLVEADASAMPFADGAFDLVLANLGVNNFADAEGAFRECRRVCAPGGRFVLTTNVRGHFGVVYRALEAVLAELGPSDRRDALLREEAHRRSKDELVRLADRHGFVIGRSFEDVLTMRFSGASAMLGHPLVKWFLDGWREAAGTDVERVVFARLERRLDETVTGAGLEMTVPMLYLECEVPRA